jgi:hypothetical protein
LVKGLWPLIFGLRKDALFVGEKDKPGSHPKPKTKSPKPLDKNKKQATLAIACLYLNLSHLVKGGK